ncbi:hypothetical protein V6N13_130644 [Hibiscus sabdariffa]
MPLMKLVNHYNHHMIGLWALLQHKGLKEAQVDELIGSLLTHELMSIPLKREKKNIIKDLKKLKLDELIGSLLTHELMSIPLKREKENIIKDQGVDVNIIALKTSKCHHEESSLEETSEEDEEMTHLFKNFTRFMKREKEKSKHEPKKKMMDSHRTQSSKERRHTKYDCPRSNKKDIWPLGVMKTPPKKMK